MAVVDGQEKKEWKEWKEGLLVGYIHHDSPFLLPLLRTVRYGIILVV